MANIKFISWPFSFESILKQAKARYIIGLTATPVRRDDNQPIIFMQCGPLRHSAAKAENAPTRLEVLPNFLPVPEMPLNATLQEVFRTLVVNVQRNH